MRTFDDPHALWRAMAAGEARYVDLRTADERALGVPQGAVALPMHTLDARGRRVLCPDFPARAAALRQATPEPVLLVLACRTGARSGQAAQLLDALGLRGWAHFPGGWDGSVDAWGRTIVAGWRPSGLPMELPERPDPRPPER